MADPCEGRANARRADILVCQRPEGRHSCLPEAGHYDRAACPGLSNRPKTMRPALV